MQAVKLYYLITWDTWDKYIGINGRDLEDFRVRKPPYAQRLQE